MVVEENTNLIVYDYLKTTIGDKGANLFKKKAQLTGTDLPEGSPSIPEIVAFYEKFSGDNKKKEIQSNEKKDEEGNTEAEPDASEVLKAKKRKKAQKNEEMEELSETSNANSEKKAQSTAKAVNEDGPNKEVEAKKTKTKKAKKSKG